MSVEVERFEKTVIYFVIACWHCLVTGIYIHVWTIRDFLLRSENGMPQWVQMPVWIMAALLSLF